LEGQSDQDRREGGEPRPLHHLPDGRGRHRTANVPRDFAAHRGATAAATTSASVRRSMSCIQEQPTEGVRPDARENGQIRPSTSVRVARAAGSHPHLASVLQQGRKSAKIHVSLGVIRGIPVKNTATSNIVLFATIASLMLRHNAVLRSLLAAHWSTF